MFQSLESLPTNSRAVCAAEIHGSYLRNILRPPKQGNIKGKQVKSGCIVSQDSNLAPKNDNDGRLSDWAEPELNRLWKGCWQHMLAMITLSEWRLIRLSCLKLEVGVVEILSLGGDILKAHSMLGYGSDSRHQIHIFPSNLAFALFCPVPSLDPYPFKIQMCRFTWLCIPFHRLEIEEVLLIQPFSAKGWASHPQRGSLGSVLGFVLGHNPGTMVNPPK